MTRQNHLRTMTLIHLRTVIIDVNNAKIKISERGSDQTMCNFNSKFLTTAFKSKIIRFKMDEDPLKRRIYFITFIDSLDMIFLNIEKLVKSL